MCIILVYDIMHSITSCMLSYNTLHNTACSGVSQYYYYYYYYYCHY